MEADYVSVDMQGRQCKAGRISYGSRSDTDPSIYECRDGGGDQGRCVDHRFTGDWNTGRAV